MMLALTSYQYHQSCEGAKEEEKKDLTDGEQACGTRPQI